MWCFSGATWTILFAWILIDVWYDIEFSTFCGLCQTLRVLNCISVSFSNMFIFRSYCMFDEWLLSWLHNIPESIVRFFRCFIETPSFYVVLVFPLVACQGNYPLFCWKSNTQSAASFSFTSGSWGSQSLFTFVMRFCVWSEGCGMGKGRRRNSATESCCHLNFSCGWLDVFFSHAKGGRLCV